MELNLVAMKMMLIGVFMLCTVSVWAQDYTEKYNEFYDRTEFLDKSGKKIGYKKYNEFYKRWEVFDMNHHKIGIYKWNDFYKRWEYSKVK